MRRLLMLILTVLTAISLSACIPAGRSGKSAGQDGLEASVPEEEIYLLYPQLMLLSSKLDEAEAYYSLGDLNYSYSLSESLLRDVRDFKSTGPDIFVCNYLDTLEHLSLIHISEPTRPY